jgi:hypothetical protein
MIDFFIYSSMITKFKIFESNMVVNVNLPNDILSMIIDTLSIVAYKGKNKNNHKNFKSIRINHIDGYYNMNKVINKEKTEETFLNIIMTNKDHIEAKYTRSIEIDNLIENSILVKINDELVYHLDNDQYDINSFIEMIGSQYKKYLEKKWKIKN